MALPSADGSHEGAAWPWPRTKAGVTVSGVAPVSRHPVKAGSYFSFYGSITVEPVVLRASRSAWAFAASFSA